MQVKEPMRRLVTGFLAASMALSLFPFGSVTATTTSLKTAESGSRPAQDIGSDAVLASKDMVNGEIAMPLVLSNNQLGFSEGMLEHEVTAYMTDLQYLGGENRLTFEEYASFFPASVDLDRVEYLSYQQKQGLKEMSEEERLSYRAAAEAKLNMQEWFIWEAVMDGKDYSDQITFETKSWTIYDATQDSAPMLACTVLLRWSGKIPTISAAANGNELDQLLNQGNGEDAGTKSITDESPEVQEFLWELYKSGLVQSNSAYDLSAFEERAKKEGLTIDESETGVDLDKLLDQFHNSEEEEESTEGEGTTPVDTGFNMLTGNGLNENQGQENAGPAEGTQAGIDDAVKNDGGDDADSADKGDPQNAAANNEGDEVTVPETQVPQAPEPDGGESEEESVPEESPENTPLPEENEETEETEENEETQENGEEESENGTTLPEGTEIAYYTVYIKGSEEIRTYGAAICFATSVPQAVDEDPNKDEDEDKEPGKDGEEDAGKPEEDLPTMEEKMAEIKSSFNGQSQGPDVAGGQIYHIRAFLERRNAAGALEAATYDILPVMQRLFRDAGGQVENMKSIDVLDHRIAEFDPDSGKLIMKGEGRTVVYASGANSMGEPLFAVSELEVRGLYHLSSENEKELDPKPAVPMVVAGQHHALALTSEGEVYGWGDGTRGALGSQNIGNQGAPQPVTVRQMDGSYLNLSGIVSIAAGSDFSMALTKDGTVYAWGDNQNGQLGTVSTVNEAILSDPALVLAPRDETDTANRDENGHLCNIVAISAGTTHSLALTASGVVYAWGNASVGQLGQGSGVAVPEGNYIATPVPVMSGTSSAESTNRLSGVIAISAGSDFSLALTADGRVYSWGDNRMGQLGVNASNSVLNHRNYAVLVTECRAYGELSGSKPFVGVLAISAWGGNSETASSSSGHALAITAEVDNTRALTGETKAWSWGENNQQQTGGSSEDENIILPSGVGFAEDFANHGLRIVGVAAGADHSLAIVRLIDEEGTEALRQTMLTLEKPEDAEESDEEQSGLPSEGTESEPPEEESEAPSEDESEENNADQGDGNETAPDGEDEMAPVTPSPEESESVDQEEDGAENEPSEASDEPAEGQEDKGAENDVTNDVDAEPQGLVRDMTTDVTNEEQNENADVTTDTNEENDEQKDEDEDASGNEENDADSDQEERDENAPVESQGPADSEDGNESEEGAENQPEEPAEPETSETPGEEDDGLGGLPEDGNEDEEQSPEEIAPVAEGETDEELPVAYKYYVYGWGYNDFGPLGRGEHASNDGVVPHPQRMLRAASTETNEDGSVKELPVLNPGSIAAGQSTSYYWFYDGTVDNLENGTVMSVGWNRNKQLGADTALTEAGLDPKNVDNVDYPVRTGAGVGKQLIFNKVWVITTEEDPDTGIVTKRLTARYSAQPASVKEDEIDQLILAELGQAGMDLNLLPVNKLSEMLTITDRQEILVFKSGIRRYYDVGFNIFERNRAVPTPEGVDINYGVDTETEDAAHLDLVDTAETDISGENNARLIPGDGSVGKQYGVTKFNAAEDLPEDERYSGYFHVEVKDADNFTTPDIQAGDGFMVALKSDGSVWAWGSNSKGQLGMGSTADQVPYTTYPTPVSGLMGNGRLNLIEEISVGYDHVLARTADGSVYAWGSNQFGQLGLGETFEEDYSAVPLQVVAGDSDLFNEGVTYLAGATAVAAGGYHSLALLGNSDGFVYSWGSNNYGQLGWGESLPKRP